MAWVSIHFGTAGTSIERDFEMIPSVGDIIHLTRDEEDLYLLVDLAHHTEGSDRVKMKYSIHAREITDLNVEMSRQMDRVNHRHT